MSTKRKRVALSIADKLKILEELERGVSGANLARQYNVGTSTISDIKKQSQTIKDYASKLNSEDGSTKRKSMKSAENQELDSAMYMWFMQIRSQGQPISGPIICEKALQMNILLDGDPNFKATSGWLQRFKSRHGIRELDIQGEKLSADVASAEDFKKTFKEFCRAGGFESKNIYNADETGLNWKKLPTKSLVSKRETAAPGYKVSKARITAMVCANYTGDHRLPLLIIGKSKQPRCFKGVNKLPVAYRNQKNSWMDTKIFGDWYENVFIPEVKKHHEKTGSTGKVLLLIDNAPSHPSDVVLSSHDGKFNVLFLPPNVTSVLQPMDQGVIETFKRFYRKQLLQMLLLDMENGEESVLSSYKKLNLKDAVYMAADAWASVKDTTLEKAWNKLCPKPTNPQESDDPDPDNPQEPHESDDPDELREIIKQVPGFEECDNANIDDWLNCDVDDPGYQILSDEEIVQQIKDDNQEIEEEEDDGEDTAVEEDDVPTHDEAFTCLDKAMKWLERQAECDTIQLLSLKRLRDLAAKKRTSGLKQKKISDFFCQQP